MIDMGVPGWCALRGKKEEGSKSEASTNSTRTHFARSEGISSSLIKACDMFLQIRLPSSCKWVQSCDLLQLSKTILSELYWTMHSQRGILFSSAIVQAVSHHWCPPHSILAGHLLNTDSCTICVITLVLVESIARKICLASLWTEGQLDLLQLLLTPPLNQEAILLFCFDAHTSFSNVGNMKVC